MQSNCSLVAPEIIRKIMNNLSDLRKNRTLKDKRVFIASLKYVPHAIFKFLENIPMPWTRIQYNNIVFHSSGAISFISEVPRTIEQFFYAKWGITWVIMRKEKKERKNFKRIRLPSFDDEEHPIDYIESLLPVTPPDSINKPKQYNIISDNISWIYEPLNKIINSYFSKKNALCFKLSTLYTLKTLAKEISVEIYDLNYYYLFNLESFLLAKTLNLVLPGGPRFEPLLNDFRDLKEDEINFHNAINTLMRFPIRVEYRIAYPYLFNSNVRMLLEQVYQETRRFVLNSMDQDLPCYVLDSSIYPILKSPIIDNSFEDNDVILPRSFKPIFNFLKLYNKNTIKAYTLLHASYPFFHKNILINRVIDIPLVKSWYLLHCPLNFPSKVRISYQKLLKRFVINKMLKKSRRLPDKSNLIKTFQSTMFFHSVRLDWVESGIHLVRQGYNMLNLLIHRKGLNFLHLDYNFNLKPIKTLTTKERKKSRFGNAFHLCREILRLTKLIVDVHIQYRLGNIDSFQLADGLQYIFSHVGHLTGIYRYKYRVMRQIRICKDLKHLIYYRFNSGGIGKGPGVGFWFPLWRIWIFFLRGIVPILEEWLGNLISRQFYGRVQNKVAKNVTKQRIESHYDLELKASVVHEILSVLPTNTRVNKTNLILQHLSEAWRCWKANLPWIVKNLPEQIEIVILRYVKQKADWWTNIAHYNRERIKKGATVDKTVCRKNLGRLTRLYLKSEHERQQKYLEQGPYIKINEIISLYRIIVRWSEIKHLKKIPFPTHDYKFGSKILLICLDGLKDQFSMNSKLNLEQKEELELLEYSFNNSGEILNLIKRQLIIQRSFKEIYIEFMDYFDYLIPVFDVNSLEKLTDAFVDHFIWYEIHKTEFFPGWMKPSDSEILPFSIYNWCKDLCKLITYCDTQKKTIMAMFQTALDESHAFIDHSVMNRLLKTMLDVNLSDYITSKNNVYVSYKDMSHLNVFGLIRGLQFSSFTISVNNLLLDLLIVGIEKATLQDSLTGLSRANVNNSNYFTDQHPVLQYYRICDEVFVLFKLNENQVRRIVESFLLNEKRESRDSFIKHKSDTNYNEKSLNGGSTLQDIFLAKALYYEIKTRVPTSLGILKWVLTKVSILNINKPSILFSMLGLECKLTPSSRLEKNNISIRENYWKFQVEKNFNFSKVHLSVSKNSIKFFENRIRQILMSSGSTTFTKISNKWNTTLIGLVSFFRESIEGAHELLSILISCETKIQNRIKLGLNSKMPSRFPPVVFYSPKEIGGLGMMSMSHINIPKSDLKYSSNEGYNITHFLSGPDNKSDLHIPNIYRYITPWEIEFAQSVLVWLEYKLKKKTALEKKRKITIEDLENYWNKGIPRINTLFQKDRYILAYDKGWRMRNVYKKFNILKFNPFWWTDQKHDGKLWNLYNFKVDITQSLGGLHGMLEHTLFKGTYFSTWEGLFWEKSSGFEETMKFRKLTNAQRSGLNQIPNRRFTLWWSPTINRANVYVGFQVQLDLTGIFMHGKIPTLKISLIQIFRAHLWQKIHESLTLDLCHVFDSQIDALGIEVVQKETIHPRKSYRMNSSCADILLLGNSIWQCSWASLLSDVKDNFDQKFSSKFWVDIQLRWGDYDSHDIERYTRSRFIDFVGDLISVYPSSTGLMIGFDIAYNLYTAYGNWIPGLKIIILQSLSRIIKSNPSLFVLRERIRKGVQLYSSEPSEQFLSSNNYGGLFTNETSWFIDDTNVYRVTIHKTAQGNFASRPLNGAVIIVNPKTGQLFLKVLHSDTWIGHRRLGQYSKWKCAEEVVNFIKSLPNEEKPSKIIVTRKVMLEPLEVHLLDLSNLIVVGTELDIPFHSLIKLSEINSAVVRSKSSRMLIFNVFDDWLKNISSYTAFSRLLLILRGLHINYKKTFVLLKLNMNKKTDSKFLWPKLEEESWVNIEMILKDLIIDDYCIRNKITISTLTQIEIRDILLGVDIKLTKSSSINYDKLDKQVRNRNNDIKSVTSVTKNDHVYTTVTNTPYEKINFSSESNWRNRYLIRYRPLKYFKNIFLSYDYTNQGRNNSYVISKNLIFKFVTLIDTKIESFGYIFGKISVAFVSLFEISCISVPPQLGINLTLCISTGSLDCSLNRRYSPLGWLHSTNSMNHELLNRDITYHSQLVSSFPNFSGQTSTFIVIVATTTYANIKSFSLDSKGFQKVVQNLNTNFSQEQLKDVLLENCLIISKKYLGYFLTPENDIWNYYFYKSHFVKNGVSNMKVGNPLEFFDEFHRLFHFKNFYTSTSVIDDYDF